MGEFDGFPRFSCGCQFLVWWNVFQLRSAQVESEENSRTKSPPRMPLYICQNKRARPDRNYGCVCVKIVYASMAYLEFVPVSYLHVRIDDRPMKSFLSTRKLPTRPRWFIHAFCTRFIRRRLFLLLSVACYVGFVTRSLCEVHVILWNDIRLEKATINFETFQNSHINCKEALCTKKNVELIHKIKENILAQHLNFFPSSILWDSLSVLSNHKYLLNFFHQFCFPSSNLQTFFKISLCFIFILYFHQFKYS